MECRKCGEKMRVCVDGSDAEWMVISAPDAATSLVGRHLNVLYVCEECQLSCVELKEKKE